MSTSVFAVLKEAAVKPPKLKMASTEQSYLSVTTFDFTADFPEVVTKLIMCEAPIFQLKVPPPAFLWDVSITETNGPTRDCSLSEPHWLFS